MGRGGVATFDAWHRSGRTSLPYRLPVTLVSELFMNPALSTACPACSQLWLLRRDEGGGGDGGKGYGRGRALYTFVRQLF